MGWSTASAPVLHRSGLICFTLAAEVGGYSLQAFVLYRPELTGPWGSQVASAERVTRVHVSADMIQKRAPADFVLSIASASSIPSTTVLPHYSSLLIASDPTALSENGGWITLGMGKNP